MKCSGCDLDGDKYLLFDCDNCGNSHCKNCGGFTASEEKCFPLSKRKAILFCKECQEETGNLRDLMQMNRSLKEENKNLTEKIGASQATEMELKEITEETDSLKGVIDLNKENIKTLKNEISTLQDIVKQKNERYMSLSEKYKIQDQEWRSKYEKLNDEMSSLKTVNEIMQKQIEHFKRNEKGVTTRHKNSRELINKVEKSDSAPNIETEQIISLFSEMEKKLNDKLENLEKGLDKKITDLRKEIGPKPKLGTYSDTLGKAALKSSQSTMLQRTGKNDYKTRTIEEEQKQLANHLIHLERDGIQGVSCIQGTVKTSTSGSIINEALPFSKVAQISKISTEDKTKTETTANEIAGQWNIASHRRNRFTGIYGTGQTDPHGKLTAVEKKAWLYVGKISNMDITVEDMINYMAKIGNHKVICEKLNTKGDYVAFKIGVPYGLMDKVMNPAFWPENIIIRRYNFQPFLGKSTRNEQRQA